MALHLPGAVIPDGERVAAHYGQPFHEESKLRAGRAFTDLSLMDVVAVTGTDRLAWLHNISTRDYLSLTSGESSEMMILDPHGHIEHAAATIDDGAITWLITDSDRGTSLVEFLNMMRFTMRVEVEVREDLSVFGVMVSPDDIPPRLAELAVVTWEDPWPRTLPGGADYGISDADHPAAGTHRTLVVVKSEDEVAAAEAFVAAGFTPAGLLAWEAARIADRRPRVGAEAIERAIPHELDWLRTAVHLKKGCYRGQETIAKIVNLGKPPRRLTYLYLEGPEDELPAPGTDVTDADGRTIGTLTSVARSFEDGPIALALLRRAVDPSATVYAGSFDATQEEIVTSGGKSSASPANRPGAELRGRRREGGV